MCTLSTGEPIERCRVSQIVFGLGRSRIDTATVARPVLCRPLLTWQHEGARPVIKNCPITTTTGQHLTAVPSSARNSQVPSWIPALMPRSFSVTFLSQIPIKMMLHRSFQGNCDLVDRSHCDRHRGTYKASVLHLVPEPIPSQDCSFTLYLYQPHRACTVRCCINPKSTFRSGRRLSCSCPGLALALV